MTLRWYVPEAALLAQLIDHPPVSGVSLSMPRVTSFRDAYCDTPDGELRQRGARYRLRFTTDGERRATLWLLDGARFESGGARPWSRGSGAAHHLDRARRHAARPGGPGARLASAAL